MKINSGQVAVDYMINAPCNLKCPFCYGPPPKMKGELKLAQKIKLIENLKHNGIEKIIISGGEPLLSKDLPIFAKLTSELKVEIGLHTNGVFRDKLKQILLYLDWIALPFDGISLQAQMKMRTSDTHFKDFLGAINVTKKFHQQASRNTPKIKVGTVISRYNVDEIDDMASIISDSNVDIWKLSKLRERGKGKEIFDEYNVEDGIIQEKIRNIKIRFPQINIYYSSDNFVKDSYMVIDPDSSVYVVKGREQIKFGKLISELGDFNSLLWKEIINCTDWDEISNNIKRSFPDWAKQ